MIDCFQASPFQHVHELRDSAFKVDLLGRANASKVEEEIKEYLSKSPAPPAEMPAVEVIVDSVYTSADGVGELNSLNTIAPLPFRRVTPEQGRQRFQHANIFVPRGAGDLVSSLNISWTNWEQSCLSSHFALDLPQTAFCECSSLFCCTLLVDI